MNKQEIFDTVATHLFRQGHRALLGDGISCAYRAPNGDMCAVGVLIPDELYDPCFEGMPSRCLLRCAIKILLPQWMRANEDLLTSLQVCHDNSSWVEEDIKGELIAIAKNYGLDYGVLSGLQFGEIEGEEETGTF